MSDRSARSDRAKLRRAIVVGAGVAGLMTTLELAEAGIPVLLVSLGPPRRSPSGAIQSGLDAAAESGGDEPRLHLDDTLVGGDFLAPQPPVRSMTEAAPRLVELLDRMGVPFERSPEGRLARRRSEGSRIARTSFAGASTGQHVLAALDEQVRRLELRGVTDEHGIRIPGERLVLTLEPFEFLGAVRDDRGACVGVVLQDLRTMRIKAYPADGVCLATGGARALFAPGTGEPSSTGAAAAAVHRQGAALANPELIEVCPTAIVSDDAAYLIGDAARGEGGRLFAPKDPREARRPRDIPERDRDYFLERLYPGLGNLVPPDVAARAVLRAAAGGGSSARSALEGDGESPVYLELSHRPARVLEARLGRVLTLGEKFADTDPRVEPLRVAPAVGRTLGGLWVDYEADDSGRIVVGSARNHATNLPGLYAAGGVAAQYHGASALGGNLLLADLYGARLAAASLVAYRAGLARSAFDSPSSLFEKAEAAELARYEELLGRSSGREDAENPFELKDELGRAMLRDAGALRDDARLDALLETIRALESRLGSARVADTATRMNQSVQMARQLGGMLIYARALAEGARARAECRGAHYKSKHDPRVTPGAVGRDDARWLRTTLALATGDGEVRLVHELDYELGGRTIHVTDAVDTRLVAPRPREPGEAERARRRAPEES